jgi:hypothetical protein
MEVMRINKTGHARFIGRCSYSLALVMMVGSVLLPLHAKAASQSRDRNIAEIVKIAGVEAQIRLSRVDSLQVARARMEKVRTELNPYFSSMSKESRQQFDAALDKYVTTVTTGDDSAAAAAEWGKIFAADFSDKELIRAVELSRTPFGSKVLKASAAASNQWNTDIRKARTRINDAAYAQLISEVKPIFDAVAPKAPPAN